MEDGGRDGENQDERSMRKQRNGTIGRKHPKKKKTGRDDNESVEAGEMVWR